MWVAPGWSFTWERKFSLWEAILEGAAAEGCPLTALLAVGATGPSLKGNLGGTSLCPPHYFTQKIRSLLYKLVFDHLDDMLIYCLLFSIYPFPPQIHKLTGKLYTHTHIHILFKRRHRKPIWKDDYRLLNERGSHYWHFLKMCKGIKKRRKVRSIIRKKAVCLTGTDITGH